MLDVLIIGAGPAGIYAAFYAGMKKLPAAIIESLPYPGGQLSTLYKEKPIYDIPGIKDITAGGFIDALMDQYSEFADELPLHLNTKAEKLAAIEGGYRVTTNTGLSFETKTILITSGAGTFSPRLLEAEGASTSKNVYYFVNSVKDFTDKNVTVLGGGDSAIDWGLLISSVANDVSIIHRRNDFRAHEDSIEKFEKVGRIMKPYNILKVIDEANRVTLVLEHAETKEQILHTTDVVLVNYGFAPVPSIFATWGLEMEGPAIKVKPSTATNLPGIFAAGNAATYEGKSKNILSGLGEVTTAIGAISKLLYPNKAPVYSSSMPREKK